MNMCSGSAASVPCPMNFAIIAAGDGERLVREGVTQPKPLVPLAGRPMLARLLDIFVANAAASISVIVNDRMPEVERFIGQWKAAHPATPLHLVVRSTPSSMHSLAALCDVLPEGRFVCTTVDTIFREEDFAAYVAAFRQCDSCLFGVTEFVDDEKPLWVVADASQLITAFLDAGPAPYVSAGIYGMDKSVVVPILNRCLANGESRMRNFQRALLLADVPVRAHLFGKVMDIDHKTDIQKAEQWLA